VKHCTTCHDKKPLEAFNRDVRSKDNKESRCRACENGRTRLSYLKRQGVTVLTAELDAICAICGVDGVLGRDHNHATKLLRGTLCLPCNSGLGFFKDNLQRLGAAMAYLRKYGAV
jgi:hypothetical protein